MADAKPFSDEDERHLQKRIKDHSFHLETEDRTQCSKCLMIRAITADRKQIEELEKFKRAVLDIGVEVVEVCMGCGRENCGDCPAGVTSTAKNVRAADQAATIERMKTAIHDCIERPKGVVPDSAIEFYDMRGPAIIEKPDGQALDAGKTKQ